MRIVAIEEHYTTQEHQDTRRSISPRGIVGSERESPFTNALLDIEDRRLREMDEAGVDMQVLSLVTPGVAVFEPALGIELARKTNDGLFQIIQRHPKRFAGLATIPPQAPEAAASELERAVRDLGLKGALIDSHVQGEYLDDRKFWPIFEAAEKLDVPIYIHPQQPSPDMVKPYLAYSGLSGALWGFGAEVGLHAVRLICSGVFDEYPGLKIILGHLGEALPFWLWRMDRHWKLWPVSANVKKTPSEYVKQNFFVTTSGMHWVPPLLCSYLALGADRILFAADYPFESSKDAVEFIRSVPIADGDIEKICHTNAETLLKL